MRQHISESIGRRTVRAGDVRRDEGKASEETQHEKTAKAKALPPLYIARSDKRISALACQQRRVAASSAAMWLL